MTNKKRIINNEEVTLIQANNKLEVTSLSIVNMSGSDGVVNVKVQDALVTVNLRSLDMELKIKDSIVFEKSDGLILLPGDKLIISSTVLTHLYFASTNNN